MKKIFKSRKVMIWASAAVSLMGVLVAAISTYAWFQIESQPLANTMVTASPNISIDNENVYGYKVNPVLGTNGFVR